MQLLCTKLEYIDFVIWTEKGLYIERIFPDEDFWRQNVPKAKEFFFRGILPELIGRWFSRPTPTTQGTQLDPESPLVPEASQSTTTVSESANGSSNDSPPLRICYCREGEHGQMVGCDNEDCPYQWFHLDCLKLKAFPKSKTWYCPECQKRHRGKSMRVQRAD